MTTRLAGSLEKIIWDSDEIEARVRELAEQVSSDFQKETAALERRPLLAIGLLKGAFVFLADLVRQLSIPVEMDFIRISSYRTGTAPGPIHISQDVKAPLDGRHILIVEDIIDTGQTLERISSELKDRGAASVKFCVLVDKSSRRKSNFKLHYVGFNYLGDEFLVGYGLDYAEQFRNLPYIATLKPSAIKSTP